MTEAQLGPAVLLLGERLLAEGKQAGVLRPGVVVGTGGLDGWLGRRQPGQHRALGLGAFLRPHRAEDAGGLAARQQGLLRRHALLAG